MGDGGQIDPLPEETAFKKPSFIRVMEWNRSSHRDCSLTERVLRNFAKFTGKHLSLKSRVYLSIS